MLKKIMLEILLERRGKLQNFQLENEMKNAGNP